MEIFIARRHTEYRNTGSLCLPKNNPTFLTAIILALFTILNILKLTLFNYYMVSKQTSDVFEYKLLTTALLVVITFSLIFKFKSRAALLILYLLQVFYIVVNLCYYLYFHNYLHILQSISLFSEAFTVASSFAVPTSPLILIAFIDLPVFIYIIANYAKIISLWRNMRSFIRIAFIISLCAIISIEAWNYHQNCSFVQLAKDTYSGESPIVERYGTIANNILNIYQNSSSKELIDQLHYGKDQSNTGTATSKPNFIIIQVESMDANIINQKYNGSYITPFLHSLSNESIYYPFTLSYHEGGGTSDCEFSIINSVEALGYYPALKLANYNFPNSMVSELSKSSYATLAFHGNVGSFYNRDIAFPKLGFNEFYDMTKMNIPESGWGVPDNEVFNFAADTLKTVKQPFLSYIITMTSHEPFNSARNYYNNSSYDSIQDETVKNYFNSMSYVDKSLESFIANAEADFKNTYIIIVGDHTPNINSASYKQASFTMDGKYFEFVPLMIITPDHKAFNEQSEAASFVDIAPTILDASGIKFNIKSNGQDLVNTITPFDNISYRGSSFDRALLFSNAKATPASVK